MKRRSVLLATGLVLLCGSATIWFGNDVALSLESSAPSRSIGTVAKGRLENGKRLPASGPNFRSYSRLGALLGRTVVHSAVRVAVLEAYGELARTRPELRFVYGETGWPSGGRFRPHRTHQNGLCVDFMVPVRRGVGSPAELPTPVWLKFGYGIEFDQRGRYRDLSIDFQAILAHLGALERAAGRHGLAIQRVIFAPEFHRFLAATSEGQALLRRLPFSSGDVWVRHDEHYHVEFRLAAAEQAARADRLERTSTIRGPAGRPLRADTLDP
jgi:penicillin-insensitive murein endopeptidase